MYRFDRRWLVLLVPLVVLGTLWGLIRADQFFARTLIWPGHGARFLQISSATATSPPVGGEIVVVAAGFNRSSGTGVAISLLPALESSGAQVFSLVYGNTINDEDIASKFDALVERTRPLTVHFFGSSMGGDVVLNLAAHAQRERDAYWQTRPPPLADAPGAPPTASVELSSPAEPAGESPPPPRLGVIFLDSTPLGADDVRNASRARADALRALTEALGTDGGAAIRLTAEMLAQQPQWSYGRLPFIQIRWSDFWYKFDSTLREKIGGPGVPTQLIRDQYGVIRRMDIGDVAAALRPGTRIVYFLPENRTDDRIVAVERVEAKLRALAIEHGLAVTVVPIPGGRHASAESNTEIYGAAIGAILSRR
jgi:pimeloyl-ACP methyl ester carboxylesterase